MKKTLLLFAGLLAAWTAAGQRTLHQHVTTPDGEQLYAAGPDVAFEEGRGDRSVPIIVDGRQTYQEMLGFGFSLTGGSAELLMKMDASARSSITRIDKQPSNKPETAASAITSNTEQYTLVLACHVSEKNAQLFIQHLTKAGYNHAEFVKGKVPRILYGNYPTEQEAKDSLRQLRKDNADFASAWVMKIKTEGV